MNAQRNESRHADPLLVQLDGILAQLAMLRQEIEARNEAGLRDRDGMIAAARGIAGKEFMTPREVFEFFGKSIGLSSIQHGGGGTACLYRARLGKGRSVLHLTARVQLHRQKLIDRGRCGDCDQASFGGPRRVQ